MFCVCVLCSFVCCSCVFVFFVFGCVVLRVFGYAFVDWCVIVIVRLFLVLGVCFLCLRVFGLFFFFLLVFRFWLLVFVVCLFVLVVVVC